MVRQAVINLVWGVAPRALVLPVVIEEKRRKSMVPRRFLSQFACGLAVLTWAITSQAQETVEVPILSTLEIGRAVYDIALSPGEDELLVASHSEETQIWNLAEQKATLVRGHTNVAARVAFAPQGDHWASSSDDSTVVVWEAANNQELYTVRNHRKRVLGLAFSPDGKLLATGSDDFTVRLFDVATKKQLAFLEGFGPIGMCAFAPDGKTVAFSTEQGIVGVWDADEPHKVLQMNRIHTTWLHIAYSPDSKSLAGAAAGQVVLWDPSTGKILRQSKVASTFSVAFSPDGKSLAIGGEDGVVRIWDTSLKTERGELKGHRDRVDSLVYSRDSKRLYTGSHDGTVKIWNVSRIGP
jgi:WD40 repeat protein